MSSAGPRSHRRPGPARIDDADPTFWKTDPRQTLFVASGVVLGLGWGIRRLLADGHPLERGLGAVVMACALLLFASYVLRFFPAALQGDRWSGSRPRRALRSVLRWSWGLFLVAAVLAALVGLIIEG